MEMTFEFSGFVVRVSAHDAAEVAEVVRLIGSQAPVSSPPPLALVPNVAPSAAVASVRKKVGRPKAKPKAAVDRQAGTVEVRLQGQAIDALAVLAPAALSGFAPPTVRKSGRGTVTLLWLTADEAVTLHETLTAALKTADDEALRKPLWRARKDLRATLHDVFGIA